MKHKTADRILSIISSFVYSTIISTLLILAIKGVVSITVAVVAGLAILTVLVFIFAAIGVFIVDERFER